MFKNLLSFRTPSTSILKQVSRLRSLILAAFCLIISDISKAQLSVSNYTGCPNQIITVTASWPNVNITSLTLLIPTGGSAQNGGNLQTNTTFTLSHPGPGPNITWTLTGTGTQGTTVVTSTVVFQLTIQQPPPLTISNQNDYCPGSSATIIAASGGNAYTVVGPQNLGTFQTNVIIVPNLSQAHNGTYTVTSIGTCTMTGTTQINIAPSSPLAINATSNVCEGGSVNLTAGMPGGQNYQWFDKNFTALQGGSQALVTLGNVTINHAGAYYVEVQQIYGAATCIKTASTQVNVVETNPVGVSASPGNFLCQNDKLSLTANAGQGVAGYSWQGPCNFSTTLPNPTISPVVPCNSGNYTITALFTNNFVTCTETAVINITVVPTAVPNPSVPHTVCENAKVQLTASGTNVYQWIWYGPNFSSNLQNPVLDSVKPSSSGPYVVTAIYTLPAITKTCAVSSPPQQLSVIQVNSVSVIPPQPVCVPDNANFAASSPGAVAYEWKAPDNMVYSGAAMTLYYPTPAASGIYTVTAYFGSLLCPRSNTAELTVHPVLNFSLHPYQIACYNFSVGVTGPSGADSYTWTSSTGFTSNTKNLFLNSVQTKDAGTYTLNVSLGPCVSKASTEVQVISPIQFTLTPKGRTICQGDTVIFEAGVTGGSQNYAYTWNPPLYMDSPTGPYKVLVPQGTVQYNLMVHDVACAQHFTLGHTFTVKVNEAPTPTLNPIKGRGCDPFSQTYEIATDSTSGITTFDFGGLDQYQGQRVTHTFPGPGAYTLNVVSTGANGCAGRYTYPYPIIVDPSPGSEITWSPNPATTSENVRFEAKHDNNVIYQSWLFKGGEPAVIDTAYKPSPTDTTQDLSPVRFYNTFGTYPVMLVAMNEHGCWDTVYNFVEVIDLMSIYIPDAFTPNDDGINDGFKVKGQGMKAEGFSMDIFNRKGMLIFSTKDIDEAWDGTYHGEKCQDGVYTYKVRAVGMNGEGRREVIGKVTLIK